MCCKLVRTMRKEKRLSLETAKMLRTLTAMSTMAKAKDVPSPMYCSQKPEITGHITLAKELMNANLPCNSDCLAVLLRLEKMPSAALLVTG